MRSTRFLMSMSFFALALVRGHLFLPSSAIVQEEYPKAGVLRFWNLPLGQVHPLFARHLVGYIIICKALGVPTSCDLFPRYQGVRHGKGKWYNCTLKKPLVLSKPSKIKVWKDRFFFIWDPHPILKSSWTARKKLPSLFVKLDAEL